MILPDLDIFLHLWSLYCYKWTCSWEASPDRDTATTRLHLEMVCLLFSVIDVEKAPLLLKPRDLLPGEISPELSSRVASLLHSPTVAGLVGTPMKQGLEPQTQVTLDSGHLMHISHTWVISISPSVTLLPSPSWSSELAQSPSTREYGGCSWASYTVSPLDTSYQFQPVLWPNLQISNMSCPSNVLSSNLVPPKENLNIPSSFRLIQMLTA